MIFSPYIASGRLLRFFVLKLSLDGILVLRLSVKIDSIQCVLLSRKLFEKQILLIICIIIHYHGKMNSYIRIAVYGYNTRYIHFFSFINEYNSIIIILPL